MIISHLNIVCQAGTSFVLFDVFYPNNKLSQEEAPMRACRKRIYLFLIIVFSFTTIIAQQRPKVGLVLSGGGAKGFAHIETLKLLDSLNFPVDYVAGTSMGGIVGGLYAMGYSGKEIERIALRMDWPRMFDDVPDRSKVPIFQKQNEHEYFFNLEIEDYGIKPPSGFIAGQEILKSLSFYTNPVSHINNFDNLPIPYRCVAVDIVSGKEVAIGSGYLALAMRSTMSIPSAFAPVEYGDYLFVDGGIANNLPVDVVLDMGAEYVIAVNVGAPPLKKNEIEDILDVTLQTIFIPGFKREEVNLKLANMVITPELEPYGVGDFTPDAVRAIIARGRNAATAAKDSLLLLMQEWQLPVQNIAEQIPADSILFGQNPERIVSNIWITRNSILKSDEVIAIAGLEKGMVVSDIDFEKVQSNLENSGHFITSTIKSKIESDSSVSVTIKVREKIEPIIYSLQIHGNTKLSFSFIYDLIALKPGERFDNSYLNDRIDELYSLGYFHSIYYTIEPHENGRVKLHIWVDERGQGRFKLGMKYIEDYNFVLNLGIVLNGVFLDGIRSQLDLEFAGFTRINFHNSYPSLQLNNFAYPFFRFTYEYIDENHINEAGNTIAKYNVETSTYGAGLGFLFGQSANLEVELMRHFQKYEGYIASDGSLDTLNTAVVARLHIDHLDKADIPTSGMWFHANYYGKVNDDFSRGFDFHKVEAEARYYWRLNKRTSLRFWGYYANSGRQQRHPLWYFKSLNPYNFLGIDYQQLRYTRLAAVGLQVRYKMNESLYVYPIYNLGFGLRNPFFLDSYGTDTANKAFWAAGGGLALNSILGVIRFEAGSRDMNPYFPGDREFWTAFSIGLPL
jgi:predicted acylesterase/phospholipase RssA